jgi:hypothetical protein
MAVKFTQEYVSNTGQAVWSTGLMTAKMSYHMFTTHKSVDVSSDVFQCSTENSILADCQVMTHQLEYEKS